MRVDFFERDFRISHEPDVYYLKPHYVNYPCVLARLAKSRTQICTNSSSRAGNS